MQVIHPSPSDVEELKQLWKEIFKDTVTYIDLFFEKKYSAENTFVIREDHKIVSMLFYFKTAFRFKKETVPVAYICGVATREAYRGKGYSRLILKKAIETIKERGYQAAFLIPASESLFQFYQKAAGFIPYFYLNKSEWQKKESPAEALREIPFSSKQFAVLYEKLNQKNAFYCVKDGKEFEDLFSFYHPEGSQFHLFEMGYLIFHPAKETLYVTEHYFERPEDFKKAVQYYLEQTGCSKAILTTPASADSGNPYASILLLDDRLRDILTVENRYVNLMFN